MWILIAGAVVALTAWYVRERRRRRTHPVSGGLQPTISLPHAAPFVLYSNAFSHCSRKTRIALSELGIDHADESIELIETGWYQTISPEYLRINPAGLVPTLLHQGHPVHESDDILVYATRHAAGDAPSLMPEDEDASAEVQRWLAFCAISSEGPMDGMELRAGACIPALTVPLFLTAIRHIPLRRIAVGLLFHPDKARPLFFCTGKLLGLPAMLGLPPVRRLIRQGREHMARHLQTVETALRASAGPWITGDDYTLADITLTCLLLRLDEAGWLTRFASTGELPETLRYYGRLRARGSWADAIERHRSAIIDQAVSELRVAIDRSARVRAIYRD